MRKLATITAVLFVSLAPITTQAGTTQAERNQEWKSMVYGLNENGFKPMRSCNIRGQCGYYQQADDIILLEYTNDDEHVSSRVICKFLNKMQDKRHCINFDNPSQQWNEVYTQGVWSFQRQ